MRRRQLPKSETLLDVFSRRAADYGPRTAVHDGTVSLTYAELDSLSDSWADELSRRGVGAGHIVPVLMPRCIHLVVTILAVLKAGAAYAPLDPRWPSSRVSEIIEALPTPILARMGTGESSPVTDAPIWQPLEPCPFTAIDFDLEGSMPASVFFTSGSGGKPKGVIIPHAAINRLFVEDSFADFGPNLSIPLAAAISWDAFALEMWSALLSGGTGVIVREPFLTPPILRELVRNYQVNTAWITSSLFNLIVDEDIDSFGGLAQVMVGGEKLSERHVSKFMLRHADIVLTNGYGPVESTVFITTHRVTSDDLSRPGGIPIGICVPGTQVFVLDGERECGRDEEGEICVAGDGLAIAYLNDHALTTRHFPEIVLRGRVQRVYRTGDLGVWASPDGFLEFRGRADRQVKIRGHRIEPQGVESLIVDLCDEVAACRVVPRLNSDGNSDLVAFIRPRGVGETVSRVNDRLRAELPAHLMPSVVVSVDHFPLTTSGKIDQQALLGLVERACGEDDVRRYSSQLSSTEDSVRNAFYDVLGVSVDPDVPFFSQGVTSLDLGRVCARLGSRMRTEIPLSILYEHQDIRKLAAWLDASATSPDLLKLDSGLLPYGLTDIQQSFLLHDLLDPSSLTNHCFLVWKVGGSLNLEALKQALIAVHRRHPALHARYSLESDAGMEPDLGIPPPSLRVLRGCTNIDEARSRAFDALTSPFDPPKGKVWSAVVATVNDQESVLGIAVHHVAFDGWSERILAEDLSAAYNGEALDKCRSFATSGGGGPVSDHENSRSERAMRLASMIRGGEQIDYGRICPAMDLPGGIRAGQVGCVRLTLTPQQVVNAMGRAGDYGASLFHLLMCAWAEAMRSVLDAQHPVVGVPVSVRHRVDQMATIGCQIAVVPIGLSALNEICHGRSAQRLSAARTVSERAMSCQGASLADVTLLLGPSQRGDLYDSVFALQNTREPSLSMAGLVCQFERQGYIDLPTPLHCEAWVRDDNSMHIEVSYRHGILCKDTADRLVNVMLSQIARLTCEDGGE